MDPIFLIGAAAFGGVIRSVVGYWGEAPDDEKFDPKKLLKSVLRAGIGGGFAGIMIGMSLSKEMDFNGAFMAGSLGMTLDVAIKEGKEAFLYYARKLLLPKEPQVPMTPVTATPA